ncbi:metal ABC transporter ATP-binding protein [Arthrobacter sp. I2-34]|uniref:Metal ABC transporter ATP-binding protein n=1 Tax=Arthrobacter hankyongi TaxID=2904801 RepID=A0ABS9L7N3_9MICC|nr:metal ABC transporter ATP-binding protein [Arthrobacter hankyongi]MCG2622655.1 metal ABC transporter ATP-binding protein [Arthrobacter hankyongi]
MSLQQIPSGAAAIAVNELHVDYHGVTALDGVNLTIEERRICGLIGVNGSGKSTLFKSLMGLVQPTRGSVRLFGLDSVQSRKLNLVTYVPQSEDVDWTFPVCVRDVVMMGRYGRLGPMRRARRQDREAVDHALDRVGLADLQHRQIGELSGGQRKRAFVARGIAQDAALMLLDEPFAGVDKSSEGALVALFRDLRDEGRTILVSTHDLAGIPQLCDEAVLLHRHVLAHGTPGSVLTNDNLARAFGPLPAAAGTAALEETPDGLA